MVLSKCFHKFRNDPKYLTETVLIKCNVLKQFILSQEDITIIFKTLNGNIWYEDDYIASAAAEDQQNVNNEVPSAPPHSAGTLSIKLVPPLFLSSLPPFLPPFLSLVLDK